MSDITIRPYEARDRERVRHVCYVTGYLGDPVDWLYNDAESFADMFSGYYTDAEPQSALVAVRDGVVVGYLLGCVDTAKVWDPTRIIGRHVVRRGILFRPGTAGFFCRSIVDVVRDRRQLPPAKILDARWPAHLHIDLLPVARGTGVGSRLVHTWLARLRSRGVPGCHLETFAENTRALAFFTSMGFRLEGSPILVPGFRSPTGGRNHVQAMVQQFA